MAWIMPNKADNMMQYISWQNLMGKLLCIIVLCFTLLHSVSAQNQLACDCSNRKVKGDSLVITGKVLDVTTNNVASGLKVTFGVTRVFQGKADPIIVISTDYEGKACGYPFMKDSSYLVYAFKGRSIRTDVCSDTRLLSPNENLEIQLGPGYAPGTDTDKAFKGIIWMVVVTIGGFVLLGIVLMRRKKTTTQQ
jgi:hypothetical protein